MTFRSKVVARNNVNIHGAGSRPMLFAHGFGCDQNMWRLTAPHFAASHQVVLFDYVGAGLADRAAYDRRRYGTLLGYAQDVVEVVEALDLRDVCFVGHSVSSMIGLLAAMRCPDRFSQLVMVSPSPCYINDEASGYVGGFSRADLFELLKLMDSNGLSWASFLAQTVMQNGDRPELASEMERSFCATDPTIVRQFAEVTFFSDHRKDLPYCPVPSLLLQCRDDAIAPETVGGYMHAHMPRSTLVHLDATGHCPHVSHPLTTIAAIDAYLAAA